MPIYPTKTVDYNFDNPACYPGSGTTVTDLQGNLNLNFVGTPTFTSSAGNGSYFAFTTATVVANHLASSFSALLNGSFNFSMSYCLRLHNLIADTLWPGGLNSDTYAAIDAAGIARQNTGNWYTGVGYNENITTSPADDDKWYVITVTANFTANELKTYVNGTLVKTDPFGVAVSFSNAQIMLGYINATPYRSDKLIDSDIKAFSIWKNVVLTGPQVQDVANEFLQYTNPPILHLDAGDPASYSGSGTAWNDLSASNFDYTMVNPIYSATEGGYFTFVSLGDGAGINNYGYKTVPGAISPQQNDFTMQCWIRVPAAIPPGSLPDGLAVFYNGDATATYNGYGLGIKWNYYGNIGRWPGIEAPGFGGYYDTDPLNAFPSDVWTLFTLTIDSSSTLKIYYNDVLMRTQPSVTLGPIAPSASALCYIGTNNPGGTYPQAFNGDMAVIRFYDNVLDLGTITTQYTNEVGRFATGPALTLELDATNASSYPGTGSTWFDLTANNNDLTLYGNTTWANIDSVKSFDFDGTNSYAWNNNVSIGATNNFTIDAWFKINSTKTIQFISCLGQAAADTFPLFAYNNPGISNGIYAEMGGGTGFTTVLASPTLDTWYNLTMTADGTDIKYYLDGALQSTVSQGSGSIPASSVELAIGNHVPSPAYAAWFDGNVGYYAVYDGAIGSTQIATNYSTNLPKFTPTPPPVYSGNVGGRQFGQGFNG